MMKKNIGRKNISGRKGQSGEIIIFIIFVVLFLMLFVSLFVSRMLTKQSKTANNVANSVQSFYMADSGTEYALYKLQNECTAATLPGCIGTPNFPDGGTCTINYDTVNSVMDVTGTYNGQTSRAIELSWTTIPTP